MTIDDNKSDLAVNKSKNSLSQDRDNNNSNNNSVLDSDLLINAELLAIETSQSSDSQNIANQISSEAHNIKIQNRKSQEEKEKSSSQSANDLTAGLAVMVGVFNQDVAIKELNAKEHRELKDPKASKQNNVKIISNQDNELSNTEGAEVLDVDDYNRQQLLYQKPREKEQILPELSSKNLVKDNHLISSNKENSVNFANNKIKDKKTAVNKNSGELSSPAKEQNSTPEKFTNKAIVNIAISQSQDISNQDAKSSSVPSSKEGIERFSNSESATKLANIYQQPEQDSYEFNQSSYNEEASRIVLEIDKVKASYQEPEPAPESQNDVTRAFSKTYYIDRSSGYNNKDVDLIKYQESKFIIKNFNPNIDKIDFDFDPNTYYPGTFLIKNDFVNGESGVLIEYYTNPNFLSLFFSGIAVSQLNITNFIDWDNPTRSDIFKIEYLVDYDIAVKEVSQLSSYQQNTEVQDYEIVQEVNYIEQENLKKAQFSDDIPDNYYSDDADYSDYSNDDQVDYLEN